MGVLLNRNIGRSKENFVHYFLINVSVVSIIQIKKDLLICVIISIIFIDNGVFGILYIVVMDVNILVLLDFYFRNNGIESRIGIIEN